MWQVCIKNRYEFHSTKDEIGAGSYGSCYTAKDRVTGKQVALKIIPIKQDTPIGQIEKEAKLLEAMDHPHIAKGYEHFTETVRDVESLCMVMELYPNGSLRQYICDSYDSCTQISPELRARWMLELLSAVDFLHQNEIIHRDLKFENLFVDAQANVFLGDFGIARSVAQTAAKTYIGTPDTIAPEVIRQDSVYGPAADMFSVGCIWYELICGERPFQG